MNAKAYICEQARNMLNTTHTQKDNENTYEYINVKEVSH